MTPPGSIVFLVDVDDTLLDNDRIQDDLKGHLERRYGASCRDRYWAIQEELFVQLGYRDYLGAMQRYWLENRFDPQLILMASYLLDYPFAERLYPGAMDVLKRLRSCGRTVILTDGDAVFQPRKVERSGIYEAAEGHVLIYVHKEESLADIERRYPAEHYFLIDDKPRILSSVKNSWRERVTTVLIKQGKFANDPAAASYAPADMSAERIGDLLKIDWLPGGK